MCQNFKKSPIKFHTALTMSTDFITTIDSDDEVEIQAEGSRPRQNNAKDDDLDPDFEFDFGGGGEDNRLNAWEAEQPSEVQKVGADESKHLNIAEKSER